MKNLILVTGGQGRFAKVLKKNNKFLNLYFATKKECNILNIKSLEKIIKKLKPKIKIIGDKCIPAIPTLKTGTLDLIGFNNFS